MLTHGYTGDPCILLCHLNIMQAAKDKNYFTNKEMKIRADNLQKRKDL